MRLSGPVFRFGDHIDTDVIIPGRYLKLTYDEAARHVMEGVRPRFAEEVKNGGIIVAGENFGCGSSREVAPAALKIAGVQAVIAPYFARIFYRNAINVGLPVVECPELARHTGLNEGDMVTVDLGRGVILGPGAGDQWSISVMPPHLQAILQAGGLVPYLKATVRR